MGTGAKRLNDSDKITPSAENRVRTHRMIPASQQHKPVFRYKLRASSSHFCIFERCHQNFKSNSSKGLKLDMFVPVSLEYTSHWSMMW